MPRSKRRCSLRRAAALSSALLLAACATPMTLERAAGMTDVQLCYWRLATDTVEKQRIYEAELARRRTVCTPQMVQFEHQRQAAQREHDRRAWQDVGRILARPMPPTITCTTTTYGGHSTTTCQ